MEIIQAAQAGTLESSDVLVRVEPASKNNTITIESTVKAQYGQAIHQSVQHVLENLGVQASTITITDQGALDCTLKARLETALLRAADFQGPIQWGVEIQ